MRPSGNFLPEARKWYRFRQGYGSLAPNGFLSGYLSEIACLRHSFYDRLNLSQFSLKVNPSPENPPKNSEKRRYFPFSPFRTKILFYVNVSNPNHKGLWSYCTINRIFWMNVYIIRLSNSIKKFANPAIRKKILDFSQKNVIIHTVIRM